MPQAARHGLAWYEVDMNWYGIAALRAMGLAWDVKLNKFRPESAHDHGTTAPIAVPEAASLLMPVAIEEDALASGD